MMHVHIDGGSSHCTCLLRTSVQSWKPKKPALMHTSRSGSRPTCSGKTGEALCEQHDALPSKLHG
jgi:hypothetical protein